ncbi:MAG: exo-beta-N-acetylmuramidase NamZ domain-containing protein, partial [Vicinamibacteria bacterium]
MHVTLGSTHLVDSGRLRGLTVGVVANPASIDHEYRHVVDRVAGAADVRLGAIFGPQHGFASDVQDNMVETPHAHDARRRVPVYSLSSETREPTADMLAGLDALVIDLQDIGARIYTYIYTVANCLRAAKRHGVKVFVCDRPNPIGGLDVEGPVLEPGFESFVGQFPIPMRHGLTIGEISRLFNEHFGIGADLEVVPMSGWKRAMYWDDTDLPWVMPSPNIPTLDSAIVYPGTVLFEGTTASEGRGTTRPFELIGAPWVRPERFVDGLNRRALPGVHFRPISFEPTFQKHARTTCGGCQIHVTDRARFRPVLTGVALIDAVRDAGADR